jgi:hypothetical protein
MFFPRRILPAAATGTLMALALMGCFASSDNLGSDESAEIGDVQSINRRPDGLFDVRCRDGRHEVATEDEILANTVCATPHPWPGTDGGSLPPPDASASDAWWPPPPHNPDGGPRPHPEAGPPTDASAAHD